MPIRDETGAETDDDTLEERRDKLAHWPPAVTRILERRYADASAGGQEVSSLGLDEVLKVASSRGSVAAWITPARPQVHALTSRYVLSRGNCTHVRSLRHAKNPATGGTMLAIRKKITAVVLSTAVMFGGLAATAAPASASAASVAFNNCLTPYVNAANTIGKTSDTAQKAVLYTGYAKCYYALSQRSDISSQTEISALTNFQNYHGKASIWIGKTGAKVYEQFIKKFKLVGLSKL